MVRAAGGGHRVGVTRLAAAAIVLVALAGTATVAGAPNAVTTVSIFAPRSGPGPDCERVEPLKRAVPKPAVLTGALRALLEGPTAAERRRGFGGWFSSRTAGMLRTVTLAHGVARVDFRNFSRRIPNASSSCGSAILLAQLDATVRQFRTVDRAVYSFDGSIEAFYAWLQRGPPRATR
jgi:hypothetical protein